MILRVGLTGGIASGKSTVARQLSDKGCVIIDADQVVADLYAPGAAGHKALRETYGESVFRADGQVDRVRLAELGLADAAAAARLSSLIHPLVEVEVSRRLAALEAAPGDRIAVVEATLLIEAGTVPRYHKIVVVDLEPALQQDRGIARGMEPAEVERRMARQMDRTDRLRHADYVIRNDGNLESLRRQVEMLSRSLTLDLEALHSPRS